MQLRNLHLRGKRLSNIYQSVNRHKRNVEIPSQKFTYSYPQSTTLKQPDLHILPTGGGLLDSGFHRLVNCTALDLPPAERLVGCYTTPMPSARSPGTSRKARRRGCRTPHRSSRRGHLQRAWEDSSVDSRNAS